ncbi:hypothetical protein E4U41_007089 [Claviceps citrina]|nr:hypothetical protein E4U41_007089 [Claviceps citrina]
MSRRRRQKQDDHVQGRRREQEEEEQAEQQQQQHVELVFPPSVMSEAQAQEVVRRMGSERDGLHRRRLIWCVVGMPITVPFALVPVIPNLPFFYLVYRAWSHWRAIAGGRHIQFLVDRKLLRPTASPVLDALYGHRTGTLQQQQTQAPGTTPGPSPSSGEVLLLTQAQARSCSKKLGVPALEMELERAIWQVEQAIGKDAKEAAVKGKKDS